MQEIATATQAAWTRPWTRLDRHERTAAEIIEYARQESNLRHAASKGSGSGKNVRGMEPRGHDGTTDVDALESRVIEALQAFAAGSPKRDRLAVEALGRALDLLGHLRTESKARRA